VPAVSTQAALEDRTATQAWWGGWGASRRPADHESDAPMPAVTGHDRAGSQDRFDVVWIFGSRHWLANAVGHRRDVMRRPHM
jgi:hypothetical protein